MMALVCMRVFMCGGVCVIVSPQTNLSNPHYRPEIFAQCTIINFIVTEKGLEDQLLAKVSVFSMIEAFRC